MRAIRPNLPLAQPLTTLTRGKSLGLRAKLAGIILGSLLLVLGASSGVVLQRLHDSLERETENTARSAAESIADAAQTFGETGDMDGLAMFLKSCSEREDLESVHAVRSPAVVAEFSARSGAEPRDEEERGVLASGQEVKVRDNAAHHIRYVLPIRIEQRCLECHSDLKPGDVAGAVSVTVDTARADRAVTSLALVIIVSVLGAILIATAVLLFLINRQVIGPIRGVAEQMCRNANLVGGISGQMADTSHQMADGATRQAASLEETTASLEEISSMVQASADNAQQADTRMSDARDAANAGRQAVQQLADAIGRIKESSGNTTRILKTIDDIAFQTNLLALNAAVEAAHVGEAGKGFAVVADEVRGLAQRSVEAAKNTSSLLEESTRSAEDGVAASQRVQQAFEEIVERVGNVSHLMSQVATSSQQQAQGIEQISMAVSEMDRVTQSSAAASEESAAVSDELSKQATQLGDLVASLLGIIGGAHAPAGAATLDPRAPAGAGDDLDLQRAA